MLWKRRIDTLITFVKRDALGKPNEYTWTTHKQKAGKFVQLRTGKGQYEQKYFGLYKSHVDGVQSIDAHEDDRTNVFKSAAFTLYIPLFLAILGYSGYYLYGFFHGKDIINEPEKVTGYVSTVDATPVPPELKQKIEEIKQEAKQAKHYGDFLEQAFDEYRPRLSGILVAKKDGRIVAKLDFYDSNNRIHESFTTAQLKDLGYSIKAVSFGVVVQKDTKTYSVTSWPLDVQNNIPTRKQPELGHDI